MKTAISVPDTIFDQATRRAQALGVSRSEFFATAAARYLNELDAESVTEQIDLALASLQADGRNCVEESTTDAIAVARRVLAGDEGDW